MGDLSEHWSNKEFACRCPECKGEYKVHLGLIGALEMIGGHFRKKIKLLSAFWCDAYYEKLNRSGRRSFHTMGKAVHIAVDGVSSQELFKFCETVPELRGIIFYPKENFIHIDTRPGEPVRLVKEGNDYLPLTAEKRAKYGL
ncbi:MAG: D-Ala-D-Ala carboxypeptidase family metallohydrolase [Candidatus Margulisbacteria bacterium]|nr:D-Ala-D-Ala carboxypeptidase family metallohydrolase [Candidatus Margulisiibacteriota bacterium]